MENIQRDITKQALQVVVTGQLPKFTKGQSALLKEIRECVTNQKPLSYDLIVECFYNNVSKIGKDWQWVGGWESGYKEWYTFDIMEHYNLQDSKWFYSIKPRIRSWFVSTIGVLVVKNQLIIIPTIEID